MENTNRLTIIETRVDKLEEDLEVCGLDKDRRIESMHGDMLNIHKDMGALKSTVELLTQEISCAVTSLRQIAENTQNVKPLLAAYEKWVGFTWVMSHLGFWGAVIAAFIAGVTIAVINL